jgi:hypothetical protein
MQIRYFALIMGTIYVLVGLLGFIPGARHPAPPGVPDLALNASYGYLLGLFPIQPLAQSRTPWCWRLGAHRLYPYLPCPWFRPWSGGFLWAPDYYGTNSRPQHPVRFGTAPLAMISGYTL